MSTPAAMPRRRPVSETAPPAKRTRRRSGGARPESAALDSQPYREHSTPTPHPQDCSREGCPRPRADGDNRYCSYFCYQITKEMQRAEQMCRAAGDDPASTQLWVSAVAFGDAMSEYARAQHAVRLVLMTRRDDTNDY